MQKTTQVQKSEVLFSKVINKSSKSGRHVGSLTVSTEVFDETKFVKIKQVKEAFGTPNTAGYKARSEQWITFDPDNEEIKDALEEAMRA